MCCCSGDDDEKNGEKPRGCTDILCLLVFVILWCGIIFAAAFAFSYGNPRRLLSGYDSFGNVCGMENTPVEGLTFSGMDMTSRPYLFIQDVTNPERSLAICVKQCPDRHLSKMAEVNTFFAETGSQLCRYDFQRHSYNFTGLKTDTGPGMPVFPECPALPVYATTPVLNRCIPNQSEGLSDDTVFNMYALLNRYSSVRQVATDVYSARRQIAVLCCLALLLSFLMTSLLHLITSVVSAVFAIAACTAAVLVTALLWWTYAALKHDLDATPLQRLLRTQALNEHAILVCGIVSTVVTVVLLLVVALMWKHLRTLADLFRQAGACIWAQPCLLAQPLCTAVAEFLLLLFCVLVLICLGTAERPQSAAEAVQLSGQPQRLLDYVDEAWVPYLWWLVVVGLVWSVEFLLACQWLVSAGVVCRWYFSREGDLVSCSLIRSFGLILCHHLGTAALGSFLVTLFRLPRAILTWTKERLQQWGDNSVASCCLRCCSCCLWCWEKFIRYISNNAYTVTAIDGSSFCPAAQTAFITLATNAAAAATINSAGDLVIFLGKLLVAAVTGAVSVLWLRTVPELYLYVAPCLVATIFAYVIADCVLGVFEMVVDTLFLCYCQDVSEDSPDGAGSYARPELARVMSAAGVRGRNVEAEGDSEVKRALNTGSTSGVQPQHTFIETDL